MKDFIFKSCRHHVDGNNWVRIPADLRRGPFPFDWPTAWRFNSWIEAINGPKN
jgi:hypothetical protein